MALPQIILNTPVYNINVTLLLSVIAICLTAMGTLVKIFSRKPKDEQTPGKASICIQSKDKIESLEKAIMENKFKNEKIRDVTQEIDKELATLKNQSTNTTKTLDEIKQTNKDIANRLEDLLKQLMDWMTD